MCIPVQKYKFQYKKKFRNRKIFFKKFVPKLFFSTEIYISVLGYTLLYCCYIFLCIF